MGKVVFENKRGVSYHGDSLRIVKSKVFQKKYKGKINLIFTSPPFSLTSKKKYGNQLGEDYVKWLKSFSKPLTELLTEDGSIVIELGNSFESGNPIFSTTPIEALLEFKRDSGLYLCQEFICNNPSRLPSPAHWVTVNRIRVKDSYTRIWWLSKTPYPKADNRNILCSYSSSMVDKLKNNKFHYGKRPSGHEITSNFNKNNGGSISPNYIDFNEKDYLFNSMSIGNTSIQSSYNNFCRESGLDPHPARIQPQLIEYFLRFLTNEDDIVYDPFGGSNTTGMVAEKLNRKWISSEKEIDYIKGSLIRFYSEDKSKHLIERMARKGL